ncbi:hypothetical protein Hanom_Chr06g00527381 [Helianthus anomalus]
MIKGCRQKVCFSHPLSFYLPVGMLNTLRLRPEPTNKNLNMKEVIRFQNSNGFQTPASKFPLHLNDKNPNQISKYRSLSRFINFL